MHNLSLLEPWFTKRGTERERSGKRERTKSTRRETEKAMSRKRESKRFTRREADREMSGKKEKQKIHQERETQREERK